MAKSKSCPHCGQIHPAGVRFCTVTGKPLKSAPLRGCLWVVLGGIALIVMGGAGAYGLGLWRARETATVVAPTATEPDTPGASIATQTTTPSPPAAISHPTATAAPPSSTPVPTMATPTATPTVEATPSPTPTLPASPTATSESVVGPGGATLSSPLPLVPPPGGYTVVKREGQITGTEHWTYGNVYVVENRLDIPLNATLIIEAGVVVKLANKYTQIAVHGALRAEGAPNNAIVFTSSHDDSVAGDTDGGGSAQAPLRSDWDAVVFYNESRDDQSFMNYVELRYGGGGDGGPIVLDNASPALQNLVMVNNQVNGIHVASTTWETNQWTALGVPYVLLDGLTVDQRATLTITPGVVVKYMNRYTQLRVSGVLHAEGTANNPIIFTSLLDDSVLGDTNSDGSAASPLPGDWDAVVFSNESQDDQNRMNYVVLRYGGGGDGGPVYLDNASPSLQNLVMEHNNANGIHLAATTWSSATLGPAGVPYVVLFDSLVIDQRATLTLLPGVVIKFSNSSARLYVTGVLKAEGVADNPIIFTSYNDDSVVGDTNNDAANSAPLNGDWGFVVFQGKVSSNSSLSHVRIWYASEQPIRTEGGANPNLSGVTTGP